MRSWIPGDTNPAVVLAITAALGDVGEHEIPMGSNRGPFIDAVNLAAGSPPGSYWCANAVARWWAAGALLHPKIPGACQTWLSWGQTTVRWSPAPTLGAVVLYGASDHASHCGLVVSVDPLFTVEGNTTLEGYSRNGDVVTLKAPAATRILGYVHPFPIGVPPLEEG